MMRALLAGWFAFLVLWFCPVAMAQEGPSVDLAGEADLHFQIGIDEYRKGNYDAALEHLLLSNRLVPNRNVGFNIARTYEQRGDLAEAWRYYTEFVRLEPDPERRQPAERAVERVAGQLSIVRITTDPPGASVYVDRKDLGVRAVTPVSLALPPGGHKLILERHGYLPGEATVDLVIGATIDVALELSQIVGTLRVDGAPAGAQIHLGDAAAQALGTVPGSFDLPPGPHVLVVTHPGFRTAQQVTNVTAGQTALAVVDLQRVTGRLVIDARERGATVEVDGVTSGFTPAVLDVPVGAHRVRVTLRGYRPYELDVVVAETEETRVDAQLLTQQEVTAASRTTQTVEDAPASVSLITAQEIRAFGYLSLYDALAGTRGVFQTNDLSYEYLGFRGFARAGDYGNRVLVTVDGHTMNDNQLGASYVGSDFSTDLDDVRQIEVVRGPGSALYGSNAFFGVLNVVSHDSATLRGPHATITGDGLGTARGRVGAGAGGEHLGGWFSIGGAYSQGGDYVFPEVAEESGGTGIAENQDDYQVRTLAARGWWGDLALEAFHNGRKKAYPTGAFGTILADPRSYNADYRSFVEMRYEPKIGESIQFYGRAYVDNYQYSGDFPYETDYIYSDRFRGTWIGIEPRFVLRPRDWLSLTAGAEARTQLAAHLFSIEYEDLDDGGTPYPGDPPLDENPRYDIVSGYAVAEVGNDWLSASAGGRYDLFSTSFANFDAFNPRVAIVVSPGDRNVLKAIGGTAFRAPSIYEYHYNDGGISQIAAEDLSPETIGTAEVEYTHRFGEVTYLSTASYFNQIGRLVSLDALEEGPDEGLLQYHNTTLPVRTLGAEYEVRREWRQGWMASFQHSLQQTRRGDLLDGAALDNSPAHLIAVKGAAPVVGGGTTIASRVRAEAPRQKRDGEDTDWAVLWDVTLTGDAPVAGVRYGLGVRNLLDWRERHPTGDDTVMTSVPQPGRTFYVTVSTAAAHRGP